MVWDPKPKVFGESGLPAGRVLAFVDDICIPTDGDMEEHMSDVGEVFDKLIEAGFTCKCEKVYIGKFKLIYLLVPPLRVTYHGH